MSGRAWHAVAALILASALFGVVGALANEATLPTGQFVLFLLASAAFPLAVLGRRVDRPDLAPLGLRGVLALGVLNAIQAGTYVAGLALGPAGPVAALHLSVPVVYLVWELARRTRRLDWGSVVVLALCAGGAALAGLSEGSGSGGGLPALGMALGALSAVVLAAFLLLVGQWGRSRRVRAAAGSIHVTGTVLLLPALALGPPEPRGVGVAVAAGVLLTAPGVLLQWWAVQRLRPVVFGTLVLSEAVFTAVVAAGVFGEPASPLIAVSVALIVAAAWIETRRRAPIAPEAHPL